MSIRFACSRSEFKSWIFLLIFCLVDLSNIYSGVLKSPTIIVWKSVCRLLRTCLIYLGAPVLGSYIASLCLLIAVFSPFTFRVNFVMCEFDTAILILAGCFAH